MDNTITITIPQRVSTTTALAALGLSRQGVHDLCRKGVLSYEKITGRCSVIDRTSLINELRQRKLLVTRKGLDSDPYITVTVWRKFKEKKTA